MILALQTGRLQSMGEVRAFVEGSGSVDYRPLDRKSAYEFVRRTLVRFGYHRLGRAEPGLIRRYMGKVCGFSASQMTRLIRQQARTGVVEDRRGRNSGRQFQRRYRSEDIRLLAEVDEAFGQMSGLATCAILQREYRVHGDSRFPRLAGLSRSHLYNLRRSRTYQTKRRVWNKTRGSNAAIAVRKAPEPHSRPGYVRVDTVHQGDQDGRKGVYLINLVDQVTQYEYVGAVAGISERFLLPTLEALLRLFPFVIRGFHADNGSQYINHRVAALLHKLHVGEFTKSRARRSNDNALVEGKNAHVVRKYLGHQHIPARFAEAVDDFTRKQLSPFLNFHRPCLYATEHRDPKGKVRRTYAPQDVCTPLDKLLSLPDASRFLKHGVTFDSLLHAARQRSALQAARELNRARDRLFRLILAPVPTAA